MRRLLRRSVVQHQISYSCWLIHQDMSRFVQESCLFFGWKICWRLEPRPCRLSTCPRHGLAQNRSLKNSWSTFPNSASNLKRYFFFLILSHSILTDIYWLTNFVKQVRPEEVTIGEDYSFTCRKDAQQKSKSSPHRQYPRTGGGGARDKSPQKTGRIVAGIHPISVNCGNSYPDPIPVAMQAVRILDLATVDINWKMLTVARPTSKQDDEFFTKYRIINLNILLTSII